jgi:hypothetical protein
VRELIKVVDQDAPVEHGSVITGTLEHCARRIEEMEEGFGFTDLLAWTCMDVHGRARSPHGDVID